MNDLSAFREAAAQMKSREGFGGTIIKFNGETGHWTAGAGSKKTIIDGRRLVLGVWLILRGYQKFVDSKPHYHSLGFVRDRHQLPTRDMLGDLDKTCWRNNRDPWQITYYLPALDPDSRQHFMYTTDSAGGQDALSALQTAFADHSDAHRNAVPQWPLAELASDSYTNSYEKRIHIPIFQILEWLDPPPNFQAVAPPPNTLPKIEHKPADGRTIDATAQPANQNMDDEIPF